MTLLGTASDQLSLKTYTHSLSLSVSLSFSLFLSLNPLKAVVLLARSKPWSQPLISVGPGPSSQFCPFSHPGPESPYPGLPHICHFFSASLCAAMAPDTDPVTLLASRKADSRSPRHPTWKILERSVSKPCWPVLYSRIYSYRLISLLWLTVSLLSQVNFSKKKKV